LLTEFVAVYLQASPLACLQRIKQRGRGEEAAVPMVRCFSFVDMLPLAQI